MAGQELQGGVERIPGGLLEPEAIDRGAKDPLQVGGVGLVVVGAGLAEMAGDGGMDDPRLEAGAGEPSKEEKNRSEADIPPTNVVEVNLRSGKSVLVGQTADWDRFDERPPQACF